MSTKLLQRAVNIYSQEADVQFPFTVTYYLTESELIAADDRLSVMIYGIELQKSWQSEAGKTEKETARVDDISLCIHRVKRMIHMLADGSVTPTTLKDVVSDLLAVDPCCGSCEEWAAKSCGDKIA